MSLYGAFLRRMILLCFPRSATDGRSMASGISPISNVVLSTTFVIWYVVLFPYPSSTDKTMPGWNDRASAIEMVDLPGNGDLEAVLGLVVLETLQAVLQ